MVGTLVATPDKKNSPKEIMAYFSTEKRPVLTPEFSSFWRELSEEEKNEIRYANLEAFLAAEKA